ncbi:MAG: DUF4474 domain-containing protein, partial [Clostridia bacterium]|nr:DUF4474 domain-containing protein [Clostridia bacterium]
PSETQSQTVTEAEESTTGTQTLTETIKAVESTVTTAATTKAPSVFERAKKALTGDGDETTKPETSTAAETETQSSTQTQKETTAQPTETTTKKDVQTSSGVLAPDMTINGLRKEGYAVFSTGQYIYNDDKNAKQAKFGYNRFYDKAASLIDFHIDTCRIAFKNYAGKDWMVQLWKGTYISDEEIGTVGCEIGLYNRKAGTYGGLYDHYDCATEPDWLYMEMSMLWDDDYDGVYTPQFTRTYDKYWWPTGFVDGQLRNKNDTSSIRILGRITFKDSEMAELFDAALSRVGFKKVTTFNPDFKDTYKRQICDVIFCWQDARA